MYNNLEKYSLCTQQFALAISYADNDWPVFPVNPVSKRPCTKHGFHDATMNDLTIRRWWRRMPSALVAVPTGPTTGLFVLDVDGPIGRSSLSELMQQLSVELPGDLSPVICETPRSGLHLYFKLELGEMPRTRAGDIGAGLDTRGVGGYIIAPGNVLPDGRGYNHIGPARDLADAFRAPRELLYLATFNARERVEIAASNDLDREIHVAPASEWRRLLDAHRANKAERIRMRIAVQPPTGKAMRRQARHDLLAETSRYAELQDGRRNELFRAVCRVAKYAANDVLAAAEIAEAFALAAQVNGVVARYGTTWVHDTVRRALERGTNDALPLLARKFREDVA